MVDPQGEFPRVYSSGSELGFYFNDTRYLGIWEISINGLSPVALSQELRFGGSTVVFSMTNRDFQKIGEPGRIPRDTFLIRRIQSLSGDCLFETVEIKNFDDESHLLQIEQWAGSRFDDVFEVRGFSRVKRGRLLPAEEKMIRSERVTLLQYEGLDSRVRRTFIHRFFAGEKIRISPGLAGHFSRIEVPAKSTVLLKTIISFDQPSDGLFCQKPYEQLSIADQMKLQSEATQLTPFQSLKFQSDHAIINRSIENAQTDIYMLLGREDNQLLYPYAGIPWFSAPFGRDGLITAYQLLPWCPEIAHGVLDYVFKHLGSKVDPFTDEQPGKVFHEMRRGEMAQTKEIPFIPYYGSVDATPLSLILLHEYMRFTRNRKHLEEWWGSALKALAWMDLWGDGDGDCFLEYAKRSPNGLVNQGWKDSHDSVMHADGTLALAPIRLCEVQAYAYRARLSMSALARFLGKTQLSERLRREALTLRARFLERFWNPMSRYIYLALDRDSRPCEVKSSNMGHCLWAQILTQEQAKSVTQVLMSDQMFSGHGIRTLSKEEVAYNPLSYHNGSVWPHDNSLIMEGFRLYGHLQELETLCLSLMGVLESSEDFRLPELFCGFRKRGGEPPIPYEVACKPQAWAAGSVFLMLKSMLGISTDLELSYLVFNTPLLTPQMNVLEIKNLRGSDWEMDLLIRRAKQGGTSVEITRKSGEIRVLTVR